VFGRLQDNLRGAALAVDLDAQWTAQLPRTQAANKIAVFAYAEAVLGNYCIFFFGLTGTWITDYLPAKE
jgi:hypothetical protein